MDPRLLLAGIAARIQERNVVPASADDLSIACEVLVSRSERLQDLPAKSCFPCIANVRLIDLRYHGLQAFVVASVITVRLISSKLMLPL